MKQLWVGLLMMLAGIVWESAAYAGREEMEHSITLPGTLIFFGILFIWITAASLRKPGGVQNRMNGLILICSAAAAIGWLWDNIAYHWLDLDTTFQPIAHALYNGGSLVLTLLVIAAGVITRFGKKGGAGFPVN